MRKQGTFQVSSREYTHLLSHAFVHSVQFSCDYYKNRQTDFLFCPQKRITGDTQRAIMDVLASDPWQPHQTWITALSLSLCLSLSVVSTDE